MLQFSSSDKPFGGGASPREFSSAPYSGRSRSTVAQIKRSFLIMKISI
ncbi:MAG: hypothetical protein L6W00_07345 [Lentisphaeria bacterium]|nr:MAG: hypothetical protein L6W00_07345 [Lentisphaeria bacterium]